MGDPSIIGVDIDAIRQAIDALDGVDVSVTEVDTIDRQNDEQRVRWTMTCEAETRSASLADFDGGDDG